MTCRAIRARQAPSLWEAAAQPERTCLSWHRTAVALGAVLLLLVRAGGGALAPIVLATGMLVLGPLLVLPGVRYRRTVACLAPQRPLPGPTPLLGLTVLTVLTGSAALVIIAAGQPDGAQ